MREPDRELSVREAARWAGVSRDVIQGWITHGRLAATVVDGRRRIRLADVRGVQATVHLGWVIPAWRADPARAGTRLRALREAHGWTQQHLAVRSGLTHEAISRLELGRRHPMAATVAALAQALDVPAERFVDQASLGLSLLPVGEAAARLGVPAQRLQGWLRLGVVDGTKVSGQWRIPAIAVTELGRSGRLRGQSRRLDPRYHG